MRILIRGISVIAAPDRAPLPSSDVIIEDSRYGAIVPAGHAAGRFDHTIDGTDRVLMPGFVNAHTHLAMTLFRGLGADVPLMRWLEDEIWPAERKLTAEDVYWFSLLGLVEMVRSGTTAFADMYFFMDEVARAVEKAGVRALLSYGIIAPTSDRVQPEIDQASAFARAWNGKAEGRIRTALSPHAPYTCGPEVWHACVNLSSGLGIPIHTHLAETREEVDRMRAEHGVSPARWLAELGVFAVPVIAAHCVHVSAEDIALLAEHGAFAVHCPTSNAKLACGIAPVADLIQGGVTVALGTDGAGSAGDLDMIEETRLAALLGKLKADDASAVPAKTALTLATRNGAAALGLGNEVGTIEVGASADGIIVGRTRAHMVPGYDPVTDMVYSACRDDVEAVFVAGRPLMLDGRLLTLDEERILARCRELARRYVN